MKRIPFLIFALLFLVIGYASINTILNINGVLSISSSDFIVRISSTIMNNNDVSDYIIDNSGTSFTITLNDTNIINYEIVNESLEYDALVYVSCKSNKSPKTSLDWYLSDNYIKANGSSYGKAALYFNNQVYYDEIRAINIRIDELMIQYQNGTNTESDKAAIMNEVDNLNIEKERIYSLIVEEDVLTCSIDLKAIEKTKVDPSDNAMNDVKIIGASENEIDVSNYIFNEGKSIKFTSNKDTIIDYKIKNTNEDYIASVFLRCSSIESPKSSIYYTIDNQYVKYNELVNGSINLSLNQENVLTEINALDARIEELNSIYNNVEDNNSNKEMIKDELDQLAIERARILDYYVESDTVMCNLVVEHNEIVPLNENIDIEFDNVINNDIDISNTAINSDKKGINFLINEDSRVIYEIKNNSKYDSLITIFCSSNYNDTNIYYSLYNNYIKSYGKTSGMLYIELNKKNLLDRIRSLDNEETYTLNILENYLISDEYKEYLTNRLIEIANERESIYASIHDEDTISCTIDIINHE